MIRIGISGWRYAPWRGVFYPEGLPQWRDETPPGFVFAVKGSRYITHLRRFKETRGPLANFFASGVLALRDKLGPFLWQFPPMFTYRPDQAAIRAGRSTAGRGGAGRAAASLAVAA